MSELRSFIVYILPVKFGSWEVVSRSLMSSDGLGALGGGIARVLVGALLGFTGTIWGTWNTLGADVEKDRSGHEFDPVDVMDVPDYGRNAFTELFTNVDSSFFKQFSKAIVSQLEPCRTCSQDSKQWSTAQDKQQAILESVEKLCGKGANQSQCPDCTCSGLSLSVAQGVGLGSAFGATFISGVGAARLYRYFGGDGADDGPIRADPVRLRPGMEGTRHHPAFAGQRLHSGSRAIRAFPSDPEGPTGAPPTSPTSL